MRKANSAKLNAMPSAGRSGWNPGWLVPFDSNWSIINKFCVLNCISPFEFRRYLGKNPHLEKLSKTPESLSKWNYDTLTSIYNICEIVPGIKSSQATLSAIMPSLLVKKISCYNHLRFCPDCLAKGYHSTIYQLLFLEKCPVHEVKLQNTCGKCGSKMKYELEQSIAYGCTHCGATFWSPFTKDRSRPKNLINLPHSTIVTFSNIWTWLLSLDLKNTVSSDCGRHFRSKYFCDFDPISIMRHWRDVVPVRYETVENFNYHHIVISSQPKSVPSAMDMAYFEDEVDIRPTFKSIYRNINKRLLRKALRQCYRTRCLCYSSYLRRHCPEVNAIAMWLNFWTNCNGRKMKVIWDFPTLHCLENKELKNWSTLHIFALEAYWSFWNNYLDILPSRPTAPIHVQPFIFTVPYWFAQRKNGRIYFHYWHQHADLSRIQKLSPSPLHAKGGYGGKAGEDRVITMRCPWYEQ